MKIYGDLSSKSFIEKNESNSRPNKNPKNRLDKSDQVVMSEDELELTNRKAASAHDVMETNQTAMDFDVSEMPMMKQQLAFINNSILNNPAEALSAHVNLTAETVAGLIG